MPHERVRRIVRWWQRIRAPWPIVGECHSYWRTHHVCQQCHPTHQHRFVAWKSAPSWVAVGPGVPVRCRECGARKCDNADCDLVRHTHVHDVAGRSLR
jgi:ribosomal protein L32